jgi:hypothetical protein
LDGILPPMLLLLRSLPPKYTASNEDNAEKTYIIDKCIKQGENLHY